ncbi:hypothetical protein ACLOJK_027930 [Asimina triloba]
MDGSPSVPFPEPKARQTFGPTRQCSRHFQWQQVKVICLLIATKWSHSTISMKHPKQQLEWDVPRKIMHIYLAMVDSNAGSGALLLL